MSEDAAETKVELPTEKPVLSRTQLAIFTAAALGTGGLWLLSMQPPLLSLVLFLNLLVLAWYDLTEFRLPNLLTLTLFLAGIAAVIMAPRFAVQDHIIGATVGLFLFPTINWVYRQIRGRDGIGLGDAKLLAGLGLWLGWAALPFVLLAGSLLGLLFASLELLHKDSANNEDLFKKPIPFGLFLAIGGWLAWLFT